jgi:hypothetical protein
MVGTGSSGRTTPPMRAASSRHAAAGTSLGYLPTADEVAGSVFFASPLSAPVTGQILNVNAGAWIS